MNALSTGETGETGGFGGLAAEAGRFAGAAPVHLWNPPHCGDSLMRIAADGTWTHEGTPIRRPALVRMFARILRKDADGFVLVTPVEKLSILVDDAPFVAVAMRVAGATFPQEADSPGGEAGLPLPSPLAGEGGPGRQPGVGRGVAAIHSKIPPLPPPADAEGTLSRKGRGEEELPSPPQQLIFTTNVGDEVFAGPDHPLRFETDRTGGLKPYVLVRGNLWARLARPLLYELVDLSEERDGETGVWSGGVWWGINSARPAST